MNFEPDEFVTKFHTMYLEKRYIQRKMTNE